jgi:ferredoxin
LYSKIVILYFPPQIAQKAVEVIFDNEKCSLCELCILTCPTRAMGLFSKNMELA